MEGSLPSKCRCSKCWRWRLELQLPQLGFDLLLMKEDRFGLWQGGVTGLEQPLRVKQPQDFVFFFE